MTIRPLGDRLLVQWDRRAERTDGGLWLPEDRIDEDRFSAAVIAVGAGVRCRFCGAKQRPEIEPGQTVLLSPSSAVQDVTIDGATLTVVRAADVMGVVEDVGE